MGTNEQSATDVRGFAAYHPSDRNYHLLFVGLCWLGALAGFTPAALGRMEGLADYPAPLTLQVHVFAFVGWLVLLSVQVTLVRTARQAVHRRLGLAAFALVPVMVLSGFFAEIFSQRFYLMHPPDSLDFFIIPIWYTLAFSVLGGAAIWQRGKPVVHKRLIVLATLTIAGVGYDRWWGTTLSELLGEGPLGLLVRSYLGTTLLLLLALGHDLRTRGTIHSVNRWGALFIIIGQVITVIVYHTPGWLPIARWIVGG